MNSKVNIIIILEKNFILRRKIEKIMFWKRTVNANFVMILSVILLLCAVAGFFGFYAHSAQGYGGQYAESASNILDKGIDTVSGWGVIFGTLGAAAMTIATGAFYLLMGLLLFYAIIMLILLIIARCVYRNEGGRLLAYRILMGIEYVLILLLVWIMWGIFNSTYSFLTLILSLIFLALTIWSMVNTYSSRIRQY